MRQQKKFFIVTIILVITHLDNRGVGRNFRRGFPPTVDPRRRGLGVQPPEADGYFKTLWSNFAVFCMFKHLEIVPRIVQGL